MKSPESKSVFLSIMALALVLSACTATREYESGILVVDNSTGIAKVVSKEEARSWNKGKVMFPTKSSHEWCMENPDCKAAWEKDRADQIVDFTFWFANVYGAANAK